MIVFLINESKKNLASDADLKRIFTEIGHILFKCARLKF